MCMYRAVHRRLRHCSTASSSCSARLRAARLPLPEPLGEALKCRPTSKSWPRWWRRSLASACAATRPAGSLPMSWPPAAAGSRIDTARWPGLAFESLIDVAGVDFLDYGRADWNTSTATSTGFSRGVNPDVGHTLRGERRYACSTSCCRSARISACACGLVRWAEEPTVDSLNGIWPRPTGLNAKPLICSASCSPTIRICAGC